MRGRARHPAKAGTTHFHAYATAYVVRAGRRLTLAVLFLVTAVAGMIYGKKAFAKLKELP